MGKVTIRYINPMLKAIAIIASTKDAIHTSKGRRTIKRKNHYRTRIGLKRDDEVKRKRKASQSPN